MSAVAERREGVEAVVEYVSPHSTNNLRYSGGSGEVNTGIFDRHSVFVRNARSEGRPLTLATTGFELVRQKSAVDFYDEADAGPSYPREIHALLRELTGADHVETFLGTRRHVTKPEGSVLNAASDVHVDYAHYQAHKLARRLMGLAPDAPMPYSRFMAINLWRAISPPPQDWPLAVCDAMSVKTQSGAPNVFIPVEKLPPRSEMLRDPPANASEMPHGWLFHHDPAHRWYYYPDMTADELLLFKLYDSTETGPWRAPHVSFADPSVSKAVPPRESYEIRSFVYFK